MIFNIILTENGCDRQSEEGGESRGITANSTLNHRSCQEFNHFFFSRSPTTVRLENFFFIFMFTLHTHRILTHFIYVSYISLYMRLARRNVNLFPSTPLVFIYLYFVFYHGRLPDALVLVEKTTWGSNKLFCPFASRSFCATCSRLKSFSLRSSPASKSSKTDKGCDVLRLYRYIDDSSYVRRSCL